MKTFFPALLVVFSMLLLTISACEENEEISPIVHIGRAAGWQLENVQHDFDSQAAEQLATVSDSAFLASGRTRDMAESYYDSLSQTLDLRECDKDDVLYFLPNGIVTSISFGDTCSRSSNYPFIELLNTSYSANLQGTQLKLTDPDSGASRILIIDQLNKDHFDLTGTYTLAGDSLLPNVMYSVSYELVPAN